MTHYSYSEPKQTQAMENEYMAATKSGITTRFPVPASPNQTHGGQVVPRTPPPTPHYTFTYDDLYNVLYNHNDVEVVNTDDIKKRGSQSDVEEDRQTERYWCEMCHEERQSECTVHGPLHSLRKYVNGRPSDLRLSYAITSFPDEVQLCASSIPGAGYGVCAKQHIPVGTWIGPYEGRRIRPEDVIPGLDTSFMWEIYQDGKLVCYLDASDENTSSWMRFIRCARYREEQNLYAFQYCGNIYYRAFRDIPVGRELLVWYDDKYQQYMGLPTGLHDMAIIDPTVPKSARQVVTRSPSNPSQPPPNERCKPPPPQPTNTSGQPQAQPVTMTRNDGNPRCADNSVVNVPSERKRKSPPRELNHLHKARDTKLSRKLIEHAQQNHSVNNHIQVSDTIEFIRRFKANELGMIMIKQEQEKFSDHSGTDEEKGQELADSTEISLWRCGQCCKSFAQRAMLQIHVCPRSPNKPYKCGHCSEAFAFSNELRTHVVTHTNEKPFKCGYCSRSFAGATTLNNHIRTHTGEKPFLCDKCGRNFSQASQLSRHQRIQSECY